MKVGWMFNLARKDLGRRPVRHLALLFCAAAVAGMQVAAGVLEEGVRQGFELSLARLGADLVAVPDELREVMERSFLTGEASMLYMDRGVEDKIAAFDFVAHTTVQAYMKSLAGAPCCTAGNIFLIGFEPERDFTVRPWLARARDRGVGPDEVVLGSDFLGMEPGDTLRFFGHQFQVAGRLEDTGSGLDSTVFIPLDTAYLMARESADKAVKTLDLKPGQISAVMIKLRPESESGVSVEQAVYRLEKGIYEISVIQPQRLLKRIHQNLTATLFSLRAAAYAIWPLTALLVGLIFAAAAVERQRELGLLRCLGATRGFIFRMILFEALALAGGGALVGIGAATGIMAGFSRLIARSLEVPFSWPGAAWLAGFLVLVEALALVTGAVAAAYPAYTISRMEPYEALRKGE